MHQENIQQKLQNSHEQKNIILNNKSINLHRTLLPYLGINPPHCTLTVNLLLWEDPRIPFKLKPMKSNTKKHVPL